jgi:hypothetical protein
VAARTKTWVCGSPIAEIAGSNPTGGMDVCLLWVLCVVRQRSLRRAYHSSRGVLQSVVCVSECDREASIMRRPWSTRGCRALERKNCYNECDDNYQYHDSRTSAILETEKSQPRRRFEQDRTGRKGRNITCLHHVSVATRWVKFDSWGLGMCVCVPGSSAVGHMFACTNTTNCHLTNTSCTSLSISAA